MANQYKGAKMRVFRNLGLGVVLGAFVVLTPLVADEASDIERVKSEISAAHKNSVVKIFSQNIQITDKPKGYKNWGEFVIAEGGLDKSKYKVLKMKGSDMWGISPIIDGKNDCGVVLWICQHSKKMTFSAENFKADGLCGKIRESYKDKDGNYKKVVVPFTF